MRAFIQKNKNLIVLIGFGAATFFIFFLNTQIGSNAIRGLRRLFAATSDVVVTVDLGTKEKTSDFELGVTYMNNQLSGNAAAVANAKQLLKDGVKYHVQHIMGFGTMNPWPDPRVKDPAQWNWDLLDSALRKAKDEMNGEPVVTLCCAPDWMKVASFDDSNPDSYINPSTGKPYEQYTNWNILEYAVLPEHEDDFAFLASQVALRYDGTHRDAQGRLLPKVTYFQVWNEMKGLWVDTNVPTLHPQYDWRGNWNAPRYTSLYNKIWDSVKAFRPDAKIGGPYLVIEASGSENRGIPLTATGWFTKDPITPRNMKVIDYWLQNKRGADFITIDRAPNRKDPNQYTDEQLLSLFFWFGDIVKQIKAHPYYKGEPIWFAEDYVNAGGRSPVYAPAAIASMLYNELKGGASVSMRWGPEQGVNDTGTNENPDGAYGQYLFTDTANVGGGQSTPVYNVYKIFHDHFSKGTNLYKATSSDPALEVLASATKILLINKKMLQSQLM